jgi:hypothetical protein
VSDATFLAWWGRMPLAQAERIAQDRPTESRTRQIAAAIGAADTVRRVISGPPNDFGPPSPRDVGGGC